MTESLAAADGDPGMQAEVLCLVNVLVDMAQNVTERVAIRSEFLEAGLLESLDRIPGARSTSCARARACVCVPAGVGARVVHARRSRVWVLAFDVPPHGCHGSS